MGGRGSPIRRRQLGAIPGASIAGAWLRCGHLGHEPAVGRFLLFKSLKTKQKQGAVLKLQTSTSKQYLRVAGIQASTEHQVEHPSPGREITPQDLLKVLLSCSYQAESYFHQDTVSYLPAGQGWALTPQPTSARAAERCGAGASPSDSPTPPVDSCWLESLAVAKPASVWGILPSYSPPLRKVSFKCI